jgi:hypothetical protein
MSEVEVDAFCDPERQHIKEGIVMVEEEQGTHYNLRSPRTAVQLLSGSRVKSDDLLKVAQTQLEDLLEAERGPTATEAMHQVGAMGDSSGDSAGGTGEEGGGDDDDDHDSFRDDMVWDGFKYAPSTCGSGDGDGGGGGGGGGSGSGKRLRERDATDESPEGAPIKLVRTQSLSSSAGLGLGSLDTSSPRSGSRMILEGSPGSDVDVLGSLDTLSGGVEGHVDGARSIVQHLQQATRKEYLEYAQLRGGGGEGGSRAPRSPRLGPITDKESGDVSSFLPYAPDNQLEYLEDCFQLVALMIRGNSARMKDDMKKEGTRVSHYGEGEVKQGRRELSAKLRLMERKLERRVAETRAAGVPLPRLEVISERLGLDTFEKRMVLLLIGKTVSPLVKALIETLEQGGRIVDDSTNVGQALAILCQDFQTQVANRKYFYRSGRLMTNGIISLNRSRWNQGSGDLTDQRIILDRYVVLCVGCVVLCCVGWHLSLHIIEYLPNPPSPSPSRSCSRSLMPTLALTSIPQIRNKHTNHRRLLDWTVGLDSEINELVEGSDLYEPKVSLDKVVLPDGVKEMLTSQCTSYEAFRTYRKTSGLEDIITYGNALVIMLCGKSGTGKTMTVNALARKLGKRVLLVDLGNLSAKSATSSDMDADLRGLFREAAMNNALLFFDECESIFKSREHGGDRILNSLLTEIERHEGIVFMATNRPYEMDEAMHRRITAVVGTTFIPRLSHCLSLNTLRPSFSLVWL